MCTFYMFCIWKCDELITRHGVLAFYASLVATLVCSVISTNAAACMLYWCAFDKIWSDLYLRFCWPVTAVVYLSKQSVLFGTRPLCGKDISLSGRRPSNAHKISTTHISTWQSLQTFCVIFVQNRKDQWESVFWFISLLP